MTVNAILELNIKRDMIIVLNSVNYEDTYSGDFSQRRVNNLYFRVYSEDLLI